MFKIKSWLSFKKSLLVMSYDSFATLTNSKKLSLCKNKEILLKALINPGPDLIVCDEGHLLRNAKSLKTQALNMVKTKRRIVLTGTPLQNNLKEYYYMVQFVKPHLLGTFKEYKRNFVNPIMNGQYEDSTTYDIKTMKIRTHVLHKLLKNTVQRVEDTELKTYIPKMTDYAIFITLSPLQIQMYNNYLELTHKQLNQQQHTKFFGDFKILQLLSTHPYLLVANEKLHCKKIKEQDVIVTEGENVEFDTVGWWENSLPEDVRDKIEYGNKMVVFWTILNECEKVGDKILVFSQSLAELDTIEHFLQNYGTSACPEWKPNVDYLRIDGTVLPEQRANMCDKFNCEDDKKIRLLLMSIKVGGLGLNLTAANRVVIMTVSWNPSYDTQSVFRTYRFGQKKPVFVYRLISLGTMEEKVYHRTINKLAIAHRVVDKFQVKSHYKNLDLDGMYSCRPQIIKEKSTFKVPEDSVLAKALLTLDCIYKYHDHQALLANRPEDNLNESELAAAWEEFKKTQFAPQLPVMPPIPGPTFATAYNLGSQTGPTIMQGEIRLNSIPGSSNSKTIFLPNLPNKKNNSLAAFVNSFGNPAKIVNELIQLD